MFTKKAWSQIVISILALNLFASFALITPVNAQIIQGGPCIPGVTCLPGGGGGPIAIGNPACTYPQYSGDGFVFTTISASNQHSLAIRNDGTVWAWGSNERTQVGDSTIYTKTQFPTQVSGLTDVLAIAAGSSLVGTSSGYSYAVKSDGTVWAFQGTGNAGGLTQVTIPGNPVITAISAGGNSLYTTPHVAALDNAGHVWEWDEDFFSPFTTPTQKNIPDTITAVATGYGHTLALSNLGTVWAWGQNNNAQVGDGTNNSPVTDATQVVGEGGVGTLSGVSAIEATQYGSLALISGAVYGWGGSLNGELGDADGFTPAPITGLTSGIISMGAGDNHSLFVTSTGTVFALGSNYNGQLGDGTGGDFTNAHDSSTPVQVQVDLAGVSKVEGGINQSIALDTDGTLIGWGGNQSGQVGDGSTIDKVFYVPAHLACTLTPDSGPTTGGTDITITGGPFVEGTTNVSFGIGDLTSPAATITFVDTHTLIARSPAFAAGTTDVNVVNDLNGATAITNGFTFIAVPAEGTSTSGEGNISIQCDGNGTVFLETPSAIDFESKTVNFYAQTDASAEHMHIPDDIARIRIIDTRGYNPGTGRLDTCGQGYTLSVQSDGLSHTNPDGSGYNLQVGLGTIDDSILTEDSSVITSSPDTLIGNVIHAASASSNQLITTSADLVSSDESVTGNIDFWLDNSVLKIPHDAIQLTSTTPGVDPVPYSGSISAATYTGAITFTLIP